jgi:hypothetical protein
MEKTPLDYLRDELEAYRIKKYCLFEFRWINESQTLGTITTHDNSFLIWNYKENGYDIFERKSIVGGHSVVAQHILSK